MVDKVTLSAPISTAIEAGSIITLELNRRQVNRIRDAMRQKHPRKANKILRELKYRFVVYKPGELKDADTK